ncbi:hypothetical protein G7Y89_g5808 [Cudoniella acicularis]|uniref:MARVEL domain-containing protein n=1 Tax=Cudoniella acicularis TaxID=354080 RepID=A0A8H4RNF4_9HELO|nr:hypothetical protein G7Y89_g5808 [Cudoniella acicularis]
MPDQPWHMGASALIICATLRPFQCAFAIAISVLYGLDLQHSSSTHTHGNSAWIYAEVVAGLSLITCLVHFFVTVKRVGWCFWEFVLFILWVSQFGVFGAMFIGGKNVVDEDATNSVARMKVAVWISFVNVLLWFVTMVGGIVWCCTARRVRRRARANRLELDEEAGDAFANSQPKLRDGVEEKVIEETRAVSMIASMLKGNDGEFTKSKLAAANKNSRDVE